MMMEMYVKCEAKGGIIVITAARGPSTDKVLTDRL